MASENLTQKLSEMTSVDGATSFELPGWTLTLDTERSDSLGCKLNTLRLYATGGDQPLSQEKLAQWSKNLASCVTGLLEPLRVLEIDATQGIAQLRSDKPSASGDIVLYYEVILTANRTCDLNRFRGYVAENKVREKIPFTLTHEVIAKFAQDAMKS
jgi:hypothetical protein